MFAGPTDNMRMEPTPERVYAIGRYVLAGGNAYTSEELYRAVCFDAHFGDNRDIFRPSLRVALELEILQQDGDRYRLSAPPDVLRSYADFRNYVADRAFLQGESLFFQVTSRYVGLGEKVLAWNTWEMLVYQLGESGLSLTENDILGWRFWASFLGLGYLHQQTMIPNCYGRLHQVIGSKLDLKTAGELSANEFFSRIKLSCPELQEGWDGTRVGLTISNGLRTLNDRGEIALIGKTGDHIAWNLYPLDSGDINAFTHVRIQEVFQ